MAEVDGRKPDPADVGSADAVMYCGPCRNVQATSFCKDCHEYLCSSCTRCHERLDAIKHHQLLTGATFPSLYPTRKRQTTEYFEKCNDHPQEDVKLFCKSHNTVCCVACSVGKHEDCKKEYIPDIAQGYTTGTEYSKLQSDIQDLHTLGVECQADIDRCLKEVNALNWGEVDKLKQYKTMINEYLNNREKELIAEMQQRCDRDTSLLQDIQARLKTWQSDFSDTRSKLHSHQQNSYKLFITVKRIQPLVDQLQKTLNDMQQQTKYQHYELVKDDRMEKILTDKTGIATVETSSKTAQKASWFRLTLIGIVKVFTLSPFQFNLPT